MVGKVGIIGPTNMEKLSSLTGKSEEFLLKEAETVGKIVASYGYELWVNSDGGMVSAVARGYKGGGGKKLVILYPKKGEPWPNKHAKHHVQYADRVSEQRNWFWTNYQVVTTPDICICVGLSAGTLSELAYIKWNIQFHRGHLKKLMVIQELVRGKKIPPEIEVEVEDILLYVKDAKEVKSALAKFSKK